MNVLIACEESQRVCCEFRKRGHNAFSCDIIDCSGMYPEYHIKQDVIPLLDGNCEFTTQDGNKHIITGKWDMIIAFPPCTYLTVSGNRWFNIEKYGDKAIKRHEQRKEAIDFFLKIANADCEHIAIENPVGIMSTVWKKATQIIQPYYFGDSFEKKTCLWLKGLPKLKYTNMVDPPKRKEFKSGKTMPGWIADLWKLPKEQRAKERSKTFPGIASAMGEQWNILKEGETK